MTVVSSPGPSPDQTAQTRHGQDDKIASGDEVILECSRGVAIITLNRPKAVNAINAQVREQLPEVVSMAEHDNDVRVILVRGAGKKGFSAGADITEFSLWHRASPHGPSGRVPRGSMRWPRPASPLLLRFMATAWAVAWRSR